MRFTLLTTALALAGTSLAAPAPSTASFQKDIQTLELTIVNVLNDIVQINKPQLKEDYATGTNQFAALIPKVSGPQSCSPFVPGKPTTANGAVSYLQKAQLSLQELSLDLMDPAKKVEKSNFHADVCSAWGYYSGVSGFANK